MSTAYADCCRRLADFFRDHTPTYGKREEQVYLLFNDADEAVKFFLILTDLLDTEYATRKESDEHHIT